MWHYEPEDLDLGPMPYAIAILIAVLALGWTVASLRLTEARHALVVLSQDLDLCRSANRAEFRAARERQKANMRLEEIK